MARYTETLSVVLRLSVLLGTAPPRYGWRGCPWGPGAAAPPRTPPVGTVWQGAPASAAGPLLAGGPGGGGGTGGEAQFRLQFRGMNVGHGMALEPTSALVQTCGVQRRVGNRG